MKKKFLKEVYLLRSVSCLNVVLAHGITRTIELYDGSLTAESRLLFLSLRLLSTFGTPIFIFLAEFLLAYSYRDEIPQNFLKKRFQYIFIPYLSMGVIYAILSTFEGTAYLNSVGLSSFLIHFIKNVFLGFYRHGYFILVIFQFYFLHIKFHQKIKELSPPLVLLGSLLINILYLAFFNLTRPPFSHPIGQYLWGDFSWIPFPGWIFYFFLGYYCGHHFDTFQRGLLKYRRLVALFPLVSGTVVLSVYRQGILLINSSKRVDMLFFSVSMLFFLYLMALKLDKIPQFFVYISRYSFGIYLFHMLFLAILVWLIKPINYAFIPPQLMLLILWLLATLGSIWATKYISRLPFGSYIVGKLER
ncbi:acyltransferase family protein [Alkaliphilus crotonatoxidans]